MMTADYPDTSFSTGDIFLRRAIFSGLISSVGTTMGWFLWIAIFAFQRNPKEILYSAIVGSLVGLIYEGVKKYQELSVTPDRKSNASETPVTPETKLRVPIIKFVRSAIVFAFTVTTLFLIGVSLDVISEFVKETPIPIIASILTLFPVGALFGITFQNEYISGCLLGIISIVVGTWVGGLAGYLANGIHMLMGEPYSDTVGWWWIMVSIGYSFSYMRFPTDVIDELEPKGLHAPLIGILLSILILCWGGTKPLEVYAVNARGSASALLDMSAAASQSILTAPDLPARFWNEAEQALLGAKTERAEGYDKHSAWGEFVAERYGCNDAPPQTLPPAPSSFYERRTKFCSMLRLGWDSGLARSFVVLIMFSFGLALSRLIDDRLLPENYAQSPIRQIDRWIGILLTILIFLGGISIRVLK